ncbi:MAG: threonylcarbamoyl-AMP synthase [Chitinispirillales bacterium]|jgi:L-threonylcarbamoyladenylate synthase|nr:threonylcarbamoyl-AMP synthase [Chitinispirillales bacterium]
MELTAQIEKAAAILREGGVVALPTETVYGLGANAFNEKALARVFEIKRRPFFDPLILHISNVKWLDSLVTDIPVTAKILIEKIWPGPLTIVLPKKSVVPDIATSGLSGVALRMPSNETALALIELAGVPVAAPSANLFGSVSPTTARHVKAQLGESADMIIDAGPCTVGIESTIISFMNGKPALLRPGGTELEKIEAIIGKVTVPERKELVNHSPGRSEQHYATSTPLLQINDIKEVSSIDKKVGLLSIKPVDDNLLSPNIKVIECLSKNGDLAEAACNLFAAMRRLDACGVDIIAALPVPESGLGLAINDRLYRAAKKQS